MTHGHVDFVHTRQILFEQLDHAGYCLFAPPNLLDCVDDSFRINRKNGFDVQQRSQKSGGFAYSAALLQIFQRIDQKIQLAGLAETLCLCQDILRAMSFRSQPCRFDHHKTESIGSRKRIHNGDRFPLLFQHGFSQNSRLVRAAET
ncbi:hypothetical protein D3C74_415430 [compost metagenome]